LQPIAVKKVNSLFLPKEEEMQLLFTVIYNSRICIEMGRDKEQHEEQTKTSYLVRPFIKERADNMIKLCWVYSHDMPLLFWRLYCGEIVPEKDLWVLSSGIKESFIALFHAVLRTTNGIWRPNNQE
jgi:hypothetical protein